MKQLLISSIFFLQFLINADVSCAQSQTIPKLNHIAIFVHDLQKSTGFYKNVIVLQLIEEPFKDGKHTWFSLGGPVQFHVISGAKEDMEHFKTQHICFSVASINNFILHLNKNNIEFTNLKGDSKSPTTRIDGVKQIYLQDPDGYWIEINDEQK